ncbi:MAG: hypothetical protein ACQESR_20740 [Planctomycetota bacterium]
MERCPTQAVLPLVGLAAEKVIRDRYSGFNTSAGLESLRRSCCTMDLAVRHGAVRHGLFGWELGTSLRSTAVSR